MIPCAAPRKKRPGSSVMEDKPGLLHLVIGRAGINAPAADLPAQAQPEAIALS